MSRRIFSGVAHGAGLLGSSGCGIVLAVVNLLLLVLAVYDTAGFCSKGFTEMPS